MLADDQGAIQFLQEIVALYSPSGNEAPSVAILDTENDTLQRISVP